MSFTSVINYDNAANFTFDTDFVEFVGSLAKLKKLPLGANQLFRASFREDKDLDAATGSVTTTVVGSAVHSIISGVGFCDVRGDNLASYFSLDSANALTAQQGTFRCKYTPDYTGSPTNDSQIYTQATSLGVGTSVFRIFHTSTGSLRAFLTSSAGSSAINLHVPYAAVSGTEIEIEFNYDFATAQREMYINGILITPTTNTIVASWVVGPVAFTAVGTSNNPATGRGNSLIRDVQLFDVVQHTANFTGEVPRIVPLYFVGTQVIVPNAAIVTDALLTYEGVESVAETESEIKHVQDFAGNDFYHDGANWVASNLSGAQSNDLADVTTNISSLDVSTGGNYFPKVILRSPNGLNSPDITSLTINYDFFGSQGACPTSVIYGYVLQDACEVITAATLTFTSKPYYLDGNLIVINETITALLTNGYFEIELPVGNSESNLKVVIKMTDEEGKTHTRKDNLLVTNVPSNLLEDIVV